MWAGIFSAYMWILKSAGWLDGCHAFIWYLLKIYLLWRRKGLNILKPESIEVLWKWIMSQYLNMGIVGQSPNKIVISAQKFHIKKGIIVTCLLPSMFKIFTCALNSFTWRRVSCILDCLKYMFLLLPEVLHHDIVITKLQSTMTEIAIWATHPYTLGNAN